MGFRLARPVRTREWLAIAAYAGALFAQTLGAVGFLGDPVVAPGTPQRLAGRPARRRHPPRRGPSRARRRAAMGAPAVPIPEARSVDPVYAGLALILVGRCCAGPLAREPSRSRWACSSPAGSRSRRGGPLAPVREARDEDRCDARRAPRRVARYFEAFDAPSFTRSPEALAVALPVHHCALARPDVLGPCRALPLEEPRIRRDGERDGMSIGRLYDNPIRRDALDDPHRAVTLLVRGGGRRGEQGRHESQDLDVRFIFAPSVRVTIRGPVHGVRLGAAQEGVLVLQRAPLIR